ncbi:MAG TPA: DUF3987 domain-containing protein [Mycobacteriales bacterium]
MSVHALPTPPALDHEAALLGILLERPALLAEVAIRPEHYANPLHSVIHEAITAAVAEHGQAAGILHVGEVLRTRTDVPNLMPRLRNGVVLTEYVSAAAVAGGDVSWHVEAVLEAWRVRQVHVLGARLQQAHAVDGELIERTVRAALELETGGTNEGWPPPTPLGRRVTLPAFPVDALPGWTADMVSAVAEFTQTPADLAASVALACLSTAAGGRAVVEVRPGWREPVNLYLVTAMPPGSRKSPVFAAMTAPIMAAEHALVDVTKPQRVEAALARFAAEQDASKAAAAAAAVDRDGRAPMLADASSAALAAEAIEVPVEPRLVADDVTPEQAASLLAEQGGRLAILSAEGEVFTTLTGGRYNAVPSLQVFLKGHAGDMMRIDRKTRTAEHVDHPALTIGVALQPEVLRDLARAPGFRGRGVLARILYALPASNVGYRDTTGAHSVSDVVRGTYATRLTALVHTMAGWNDPAVLPLTLAANQAVLSLEAQIEPRLRPDGDLVHIADWAAKWVGAVVRIAGLLHLATRLRDGWGRAIGPDTIDQAARIGYYYLAHAQATFDLMGADPIVDDARFLLDHIGRTGATRVTRRDLMVNVSRSRFRKVTDLDPALTLLEQHGYLRPVPQPARTGRGRPASPGYDVHPELTAGSESTPWP